MGPFLKNVDTKNVKGPPDLGESDYEEDEGDPVEEGGLSEISSIS